MGERIWTPYQIEIILHHHCSAGRFPRADAPIYPETLQWIAEAGLIEWIEGIPRTTRAVYVDPRISPKEQQ